MDNSIHAMVLELATEKKKKVSKTSSKTTKESCVALWNYLCGDGDIRHLHDYYDLLEQGK